MCYINDVCIRSNTCYDAFHYTYISIANAKVGHKSDNWTRIGEILLSHTTFLNKTYEFHYVSNSLICYALIHLCAILAKMSTVVINESILYFRVSIFHG